VSNEAVTDGRPWHAAVPRSWETYFAVCAAAMAVFIGSVEHDGRRPVVWGLLAAMVLWYAVFGRAVIARPEPYWRGWLFQAVLLALFAASLAEVGLTSFLLFALCPIVYMTLPIKPAHVVVGVYAFTPAAVVFVLAGWEAMAVLVPLGAIVTAMSIVTALTTERIERTSEERAALIAELESSRAEVARLSRAAGVAEERQRLAGDIHDTVAQGLSSVVMLVEAADGVLHRDTEAARRYLAMIARTARENLDETRAIVAALTPAPLVEATLPDALRRLADRFSDDSGTAATVVVEGEARALPTGTEVVLLRVAQEALTNAGKHAKASSVAIALEYKTGLDYENDHVELEVVDDGIGFDVEALSSRYGPSGYGLGTMRARVEQIGGELTVTSTPESGTAIRTRVTA
jgi:signal transduction histidine kinase